MKLALLIRKLRRNINDYGLVVAFKKGFYYSIKYIYETRVYRIYTINLQNYAGEILKDTEFTFRLINDTDSEEIHQIEAMEEWLTGKVVERLKRGSLCLVAMDKDRVAGFNLVVLGKVFIPLVGMTRRLNKHTAWSEQITVNKNYRGKGLGEQLRYRTFMYLKNHDIWRLTGGTLSDNKANLALTRKVGFREYVDIHYSRIFGVKSRKYVRIR
jgi:L-amino acid N-acyltransferase YncA